MGGACSAIGRSTVNGRKRKHPIVQSLEWYVGWWFWKQIVTMMRLAVGGFPGRVRLARRYRDTCTSCGRRTNPLFHTPNSRGLSKTRDDDGVPIATLECPRCHVEPDEGPPVDPDLLRPNFDVDRLIEVWHEGTGLSADARSIPTHPRTEDPK